MPAPVPRWIRWTYALLGAWLVLAALRNAFLAELAFAPLSNRFVHVGVLYVAAALCFVRVRHRHQERVGWLLVAVGIAAWAAGETYYVLVLWTVDVVPFPSPADAGYLLTSALLLAGLVRIARGRAGRPAVPAAADALTAGLAVAALSAAVVLRTAVETAPSDPVGAATASAYPVWDLVLGSYVVGMAAAAGWRLSRSWCVVLVGIVLFWIADSLYLKQTAAGTYVSGSWFDAGWWAGLCCLSVAAWLRADPARGSVEVPGMRVIALPLGFGVLGLALLVAAAEVPVGAVAVGLAAMSLLAVMTRLLVTYQANLAMLATSREEALIDPLTGLGNRRALSRRLEAVSWTDPDAEPLALVLFDLDGFKAYNDLFGHPAGDALLTRLGSSLDRHVDGRGTAYRMGGDEFCALLRTGEQVAQVLGRRAATSLSERGEGFAITASFGVVVLPLEATAPEVALRVADQRMYAHKHARRGSAGRHTREVLLRVLAERDPHLNEHIHDVAANAGRIARELALEATVVDDVMHAAELHDIGKVAIPDAVLNKPGPLDADEWALMRTHTLIGERIVDSAPDLRGVAKLVRASHERWDGGGYPDGLAGEAVPLGARIVAVADAFDAMVSERPYRRAVSADSALVELRRCAGGQFDPVVVEAFGAVLERQDVGSAPAAGPLNG